MKPPCGCGDPSTRDYEDVRLCEEHFASVMGSEYKIIRLHEKIDRLAGMIRQIARSTSPNVCFEEWKK